MRTGMPSWEKADASYADVLELCAAGVDFKIVAAIRKILYEKNCILPALERSGFLTMRRTEWQKEIKNAFGNGKCFQFRDFKRFVEALAKMPYGGNDILSVVLTLPEMSGEANPEITFHSEKLSQALGAYQRGVDRNAHGKQPVTQIREPLHKNV